jgi:hypothetical protein
VAGGNQSAFGYRYQYIATIERFLAFLRERLDQRVQDVALIALHVEPTTLSQEGIARDDDIVDFAIELDRAIVERVQVKGSSKPESNNLYPLEADRVFDRLNGQVATCSVLLTNRPLGPGLRDRCSQSADTDDYEHWTHYSVGVGQNDGDDDREVLIVIDKRSIADLTRSIENLVRGFRSDQHLGLSSVSCRIVTKLLLDAVFRSATGDGPSRLDALDIIKLNRPGMSGDSTSWEGWSHVRWFVEEVPAGAA